MDNRNINTLRNLFDLIEKMETRDIETLEEALESETNAMLIRTLKTEVDYRDSSSISKVKVK